MGYQRQQPSVADFQFLPSYGDTNREGATLRSILHWIRHSNTTRMVRLELHNVRVKTCTMLPSSREVKDNSSHCLRHPQNRFDHKKRGTNNS